MFVLKFWDFSLLGTMNIPALFRHFDVKECSVSSRIFSSCGGRTISHAPRPLPTQESRALRIEFIITKKDK